MKETMTILSNSETVMKRVHRTFPMDSFVLFENHDGTTLVVRHDVAVLWDLDKRVEVLPKPDVWVSSFEWLLGWAALKGFTHVSFNEGDGWEPRRPFAEIGFLPPFWGDFKIRFYRGATGSWKQSMTLYPVGGGFYRHVKELF